MRCLLYGDAGTAGFGELCCWETRLACDASWSRRDGRYIAIGWETAVLDGRFGVGKNIEVVGFSEVVAAHRLAFLWCCAWEEWGGWCGWEAPAVWSGSMGPRVARDHVRKR